MKRALPFLLSALLLPACIATETGNPPIVVEDESLVVEQASPPAPGDPITTSIDGPAATVSPASGQVEVRLLDSDAPTVVSPVMADGSFSISFDEEGGERFRMLVRDGAEASAPLDATAGFEGLTPLPQTDCIVVSPTARLDTTTVSIRNDCAFSVTRGAASLRLPSAATVEDGALEIPAGGQAEVTVTGLTDDNTLLLPLLTPTEELRAVTFLSD